MEKKEKSFLVYLATDHLRFRNIFRTINGGIISFVVQLEIEAQPATWKAVVRNDCEHGFCHRDLIYSDGHKEKIKMVADKESAVVVGIDDLKENFKDHLQKLGYQGFLRKLPNYIEIERDLEQAKQFLLRLIRHPEKIDEIGNEIRLKLWEVIVIKNKVTAVLRDKTGKVIKIVEGQ